MSDHLSPSPASTSAPGRRLGPSPWLWMILGCALVAASGAVRVNQELQFADASRAAETPPFPMRDLPRTVGGHWEMVGEELELPPETQQIAGCSDYMYRAYEDDRTGVAVRVLVAFGPASLVYPHTPQVCFPANGYQHRGGPWRRVIISDDASAADPGSSSADPLRFPFHVLTFGKATGGLENLQEVYYSFWHDGTWSPTAEATERLFRHRPAMIKIQVERPIIPGEKAGDADGPIEDFLRGLVPEIQRRLDAAATSRAEA
ncbi:exosortase-associated EpsI family protein [Tautonia sociabilis]|uniref:Exosortase-associated EpsI family protein n=1 Tax=Tautonia sociabilis TaxID=2080755 RepID=A0A432MFP1_9BACT|nr:exosortase-associated EpsI family protein [Tautonia sociabilis]RUL84916.1 exosortase-associated EpsI family protein [Tautonia sociabilis]